MVCFIRHTLFFILIVASACNAQEFSSQRRLGLQTLARSVMAGFDKGIDAVTDSAISALKNFVVSGVDHVFGESKVVVSNDARFSSTVFTTDNYYADMLDFLIAGRQPCEPKDCPMQSWYLQNTGRTEVVADLIRAGPGPNTHTYMGFYLVKETLEKFGDKIEDGTLLRQNELGMQILAPGAWPEMPGGKATIGLGQTHENHAFVRPFLAHDLDNSDNWDDEWLRSKARSFFDSRDEFSTSDISWWTTQILHKLHLNMELSEQEARAFASYMSKMIILIPLGENILKHPLTESLLGVADTLNKKLNYLDVFKNALRAKYAERDFVLNNDESKITLLASVILDSLQFAGGLSVPSVISIVLALTSTTGASKPDSLKNLKLSNENIDWILWETLRLYAPVAGVPFWEKVEGQTAYKHIIPNVAQALMDGSVFPQPRVFKHRGLDQYHSLMEDDGMPWAGPAKHNGKNDGIHSHNCPAQHLSFKMMKIFLQEFARAGKQWKALQADKITVNPYGASTVSYLKVGLSYTTSFSYWPSCKEGYSWISTKWKWWGGRSWTCKVLA